MRLVTRNQTILTTDIDQNDVLINGVNTVDDTAVMVDGSGYIKLPTGNSAYVEFPKPPAMATITFLKIETDSPILIRLNTADGTSGTEIPVSPILTPALSQANPSPSPQVTPSVQKGELVLRAGGSADGNTITLTRVWFKNPGITPATVKVTMVGE